jgi:hypothetical protein
VKRRLDRRTRLRAELHPSLLVGLTPDRFARRPLRTGLLTRPH